MKFDKVQNIEELSDSDIVKYALEKIFVLEPPKADIAKYLNNITSLGDADNHALEKNLMVFTRWQNYYANQLVLVDAIKTSSESQMNYFWANAIDNAGGTINTKKELAVKDKHYVNSKHVYDKACVGYEAIRMRFDNCERAIKLISRILTVRLGTRPE